MKIYVYVTVFFFAVTLTSHAQLRVPAQSPSASLKQKIGLTDVEISYARPSKRERLIFGEEGLLPYGEFWRVGANAATKITFSEDVFLDGEFLERGSYTLLAKPGIKTWALHWYVYDSGDWNSYVKAKPALELEVPVTKRATVLETLELHFGDITLDSATLLLEWDQVALKIPLKVDEKEKIQRAIAGTLSGPSSFDYYFAALYLHESQTDLETALAYIQKVTSSQDALFFQVSREAFILQDLGRIKEAEKVAERGLQLSRKVGNKDFIRMNLKILNQ